MSSKLMCDGCGKEIVNKNDHVIHGERVDGMSGAGIPNGEFDLCTDCAQTTFDVLKQKSERSRRESI